MRERNGKNTDKENLGELWDIYYNNRFVKNLQLKFTHLNLNSLSGTSVCSLTCSPPAPALLLPLPSWPSLTGWVGPFCSNDELTSFKGQINEYLSWVVGNDIDFAEVHERDETVHPVHCCRPTQGHCQCSICGEENVEMFEYDDRMRMTQK